MSEDKKEIHVNDLVIKANHVSFEPPERKEPFFGSEKPDLWKGTEQKKREELETEHENEGYDKEEFVGERRRPPFFWFKITIKHSVFGDSKTRTIYLGLIRSGLIFLQTLISAYFF